MATNHIAQLLPVAALAGVLEGAGAKCGNVHWGGLRVGFGVRKAARAFWLTSVGTELFTQVSCVRSE